jgi:hypothetical protein
MSSPVSTAVVTNSWSNWSTSTRIQVVIFGLIGLSVVVVLNLFR